MNLAFATDSKRFSKAVEQLRKEGLPIDEETIKERYELLGKAPETVIVKTETVTEAPKKKTKKAK